MLEQALIMLLIMLLDATSFLDEFYIPNGCI